MDFPTATLNTILFGGRLAVIDNPELRERIVEWQGALDEIADVAAHDWELAVNWIREYVRENANLAQLSNVMEREPDHCSRLNCRLCQYLWVSRTTSPSFVRPSLGTWS